MVDPSLVHGRMSNHRALRTGGLIFGTDALVYGRQPRPSPLGHHLRPRPTAAPLSLGRGCVGPFNDDAEAAAHPVHGAVKFLVLRRPIGYYWARALLWLPHAVLEFACAWRAPGRGGGGAH